MSSTALTLIGSSVSLVSMNSLAVMYMLKNLLVQIVRAHKMDGSLFEINPGLRMNMTRSAASSIVNFCIVDAREPLHPKARVRNLCHWWKISNTNSKLAGSAGGPDSSHFVLAADSVRE